MRIVKSIILVTSLSFFISCNSPQTYLNKAVDIIKANSINKNSIDWVQFRKDVLEKGKEAENIKETYPAIQYALRQLGDHHSFFMTPEQCKTFNDPNLPLPKVSSELIDNRIGYIKIPGFMGNRNERAYKFAQQIQDKIRELDKNNIQYWIVDLGDDTGGNMWPMLTGLGPILGDGIAGYFANNDSVYISWGYSKGTVFCDKNQLMKLNNPYKLKNDIKKLAIIISNHTCSSGEATAVSFIGIKNSCFIGEPSYGNSTSNAGFKLSDGAMIFLTVSKFADRNKKTYGVPINPDIVDYNGTAKKTAIEWINKK
ncbi:MAG: S41 family peptidase [Bacteroidota bacterium]|nr:S41 family peptidase [Bacteroidota bacterium]